MATVAPLQQALQPLLDWLSMHVNAHRFLWLLALVSFLIAWNRGIALLYGLVALLLAVIAISWLLPWLSVRSLRITRRQMGPAQVGQMLSLHYRITAPRPRYHIVLKEHLPCSHEQPQQHFLPTVQCETTFSAQVPCNRRGVFLVDTIDIACGWPFGFVDFAHRQTIPSSRLVVLPKTFRIAHLPLLRSDIAAPDGYSQTARPDMHNEFAAVREYRFGDSLKHIHWSASARHQTLVVREYESHDRPYLLLVLDARAEADIGEAPNSTFEFAVTIAASIIEYSIEHQLGLHLVALGQQPMEITVNPGSRSSFDYLERLAWLQSDGTTSYSNAVSYALHQYDNVGTLITFSNHSENATSPAPKGVGHLKIVFQDESFHYPMRRYKEGWLASDDNHRTLSITRTSDLARLFQQ